METALDISVLFITYNRSDLLEITLQALRERVAFGGLRVEFVVSDDRSGEPHLSHVLSMPFDRHLISETNEGLGHNCNKGIAGTGGRYLLQIQDDCEFIGDSAHVLTALRVLEGDPQVGCVQLDMLTHDVAREQRRLPDGTVYWVFENDGIPRRRRSAERPYSDQPHLKRRQFHEDIGPYQEGTAMSDMEVDYQRRVACQQRWRVAVLEARPSFRHLGGARSFNPSYARAERLARLYAYPLLGPIFCSIRPAARLVRDLVRGAGR